MERVFYVEDKTTKELKECPQPAPKRFASLKRWRQKLCGIVGPHPRISAEQFVDMYQGRKKTIYANAAASLLEKPIERRDARLKTFIKAEKFCISDKPDPAPRVIQPREPRYNVELGRYLKPLEHHIYHGLDCIWGGPTVMKGYNVGQVAEHIVQAWNEFQTPVAVGFDMSRFDQHVSVPALQFEHSIYRRIFGNDPHLSMLLSWQIDNFGIGFAHNGLIRYKKTGCRMSGDMNTALGNCILACLITKELMRKIKCRLINNGDDCVLILDKKNLDYVVSNLTTGWSEFGFNCIAEEPVYELEQIRFCQMAPIYDGESWLMVRDPKVSLSKDSYSLVFWDSKDNIRRWFKSVGDCGIALAGGVPVVQEFYRTYQRYGGDVTLNGSYREHCSAGIYGMLNGSKRTYQEPTQEARYSFYKAFGLPPDGQIAMEEHYSQEELDLEFAAVGTDYSYKWT